MPISGIYRITCKPSARNYVGYSCHVSRRWWHHKSVLRSGTHSNFALQLAWDKHGEENFEFVLLEECNRHLSCFYEQDWMEKLNAPLSRGGFNLMESVALPVCRSCSQKGHLTEYAKKKRKVFSIISPEGKTVSACGVNQFCREHNLNKNSLRRVMSGQAESHKGWKRVDHKEPEKRIFIDPLGREHAVSSAKELSILTGGKHVKDLYSFRCKSYKGWSYVGAFCKLGDSYYRKERKKIPSSWVAIGKNPYNDAKESRFTLIDCNGKELKCVGINKTAKRLGLSRSRLIKLCHGRIDNTNGYSLKS